MSELEKAFLKLRDENSKYSIQLLEKDKQIEILKNALEFYADKESWTDCFETGDFECLKKDDLHENSKYAGNRAARALEEIKGE